MLISVTAVALGRKLRDACREALAEAICEHPARIREHQGTLTLPRDACPDAAERAFRRIERLAVAAGGRLVGRKLSVSYADLVRRPCGRPMERHVDDEAYPERVCTVVVPLHDIPPQLGGQTVVDFGRIEHRFDHVAGRMLVFESRLPHWTVAPGEDRDAMLMWLEEAP